MKAIMIVSTVGALCLATGAVAFAEHHESGDAQEGQGQISMPSIGPPEEMKLVESMNGEYAVKFLFKMDPMSEEWTETEATAVLSAVVGGGAHQMLFEGEMMGMPFAGMGLTSFDLATQKWQSAWVDSMGARISMYTGDFKDGEIVVTGTDIEPDGMKCHSRLTIYNITEKGVELEVRDVDGWHELNGCSEGDLYEEVGLSILRCRQARSRRDSGSIVSRFHWEG